jgi:hypothetical protein
VPHQLDSLILTDFILPYQFYHKLLAAAEVYEINKIEGLLTQLGQVHPEFEALISHFNHYIVDYDIDQLVEDLQQVGCEDE